MYSLIEKNSGFMLFFFGEWRVKGTPGQDIFQFKDHSDSEVCLCVCVVCVLGIPLHYGDQMSHENSEFFFFFFCTLIWTFVLVYMEKQANKSYRMIFLKNAEGFVWVLELG